MTRKGFTLIELLVVIAILSTAGLLVMTIFANALRGSNKAQILSAIQKNGRSTLDTMDKTIRNSDNLVCISNNATSLVVSKDGTYTRYRFVSDCGSQNGCILQDNPIPDKNVSWTDPNTGTVYTTDYLPAFDSKICADADPLASSVSLTDTDSQSGVSIINGLFSKSSSSGFKNQVTVKFDVTAGLGAPSFLTGQIDPVNFVTTINLR